jgi:hypothetical protein
MQTPMPAAGHMHNSLTATRMKHQARHAQQQLQQQFVNGMSPTRSLQRGELRASSSSASPDPALASIDTTVAAAGAAFVPQQLSRSAAQLAWSGQMPMRSLRSSTGGNGHGGTGGATIARTASTGVLKSYALSHGDYERSASSATLSLLGGASSAPVPLAAASEAYSSLRDRITELQYQLSALHRKMRQYEHESETWMLRYSRRLVVVSNLMLAISVFLLRFVSTFRDPKRAQNGLLTRILRLSPSQTPAVIGGGSGSSGLSASALSSALSSAVSVATERRRLPLSRLLLMSLLHGFEWSLLFFVSLFLHLRPSHKKKNMAFLLSSFTSCVLLFRSQVTEDPRAAHAFNVAINCIHFISRYYYLHGLIVYQTLRIL